MKTIKGDKYEMGDACVALSAMTVSAWWCLGSERRDGQDRLGLTPLSGLMAAVGTNQLKTFQMLAEEFGPEAMHRA